MKKRKYLLFLLLSGLFITHAHASDVEYQTIQNENIDRKCEVVCNVPYSYSTTIPKEKITETYQNVQTGDETSITLFSAIFLVSGIMILINLKGEIKKNE